MTEDASMDFHEDLVGAGLGLGNVLNLPGTAFSRHDSSLHIRFLHGDSMREFEKLAHRFLQSRFFCPCLGEIARGVRAKLRKVGICQAVERRSWCAKG